jgi:Mu-like prophage major head subunit gpT
MSAGALTPSFVFKYEKQMRAIQEDELRRAVESKNLFWSKLSKALDIQGASERMTWFLNTASIKPDGFGGTQRFEPLVTQTTELVPQRYISGISVKRDELLDLKQAGGLDILSEWVKQITTASAYLPQRLLTELLMNGANTDGSATAYDGQPFFSDITTNGGTAHPYNPYKPKLGGFANWLHSTSSGSYPGACPIDSTNAATVDTAVTNFQKVIAYIRSWKMPDGITPRFLTPAVLVHPPAMTARVAQMFNAKFIAMAAATGGGAADIEGFTRSWGTVDLIESPEIGASTSYSTQLMMANQPSAGTGQSTGVVTPYTETITGSDTTFYVGMRENMSSVLGGIVHIIREPWRVNYFSGDGSSVGAMTGLDAILNRALEIEYHLTGRLSMQFGHPYTWLRVDAT